MAEVSEITNREHDQITGAKRVSLFPSTAKKIIDEAGAPAVTYLGWAAPGTATSASTWFVELITVSGTTTTFTHATGIWDNRASLTYT